MKNIVKRDLHFEQETFDPEWVDLIKKAKSMGLTLEETRLILKELRKSNISKSTVIEYGRTTYL